MKKTQVATTVKSLPKSSDGAIKDVLAIIRNYEPEDQNTIIESVLLEIGIERHLTVENCQNAISRAAKNADTFFGGNDKIASMVKENISKLNTSNKRA